MAKKKKKANKKNKKKNKSIFRPFIFLFYIVILGGLVYFTFLYKINNKTVYQKISSMFKEKEENNQKKSINKYINKKKKSKTKYVRKKERKVKPKLVSKQETSKNKKNKNNNQKIVSSRKTLKESPKEIYLPSKEERNNLDSFLKERIK